MLNSTTETRVLAQPQTLVVPVRTILTVRLALGWTVLIGAFTFLFGTCWDIQWHADIGRDRTLTMPHLVMLAGIALSGVTALTAILAETWLARHNKINSSTSTPFANLFASSLGAYIAGFASLTAAIAFPLDSYWHTIYGIDVALFAPFHFMFIVGMGIVALGACYMLVSASNLAGLLHSPGARLTANAGIAFGFVVTLGHFLLYGQSTASAVFRFPVLGLTISFYPLLVAFIVAIGLTAARQILPWRASATIVGGLFLALDIIIFLTVPFLVTWLSGVEQLGYKDADGAGQVVAASVWPQTLILTGVILDLLANYVRHKGANGVSTRLITGAASVAIALTITFSPLFILYVVSHQGVGPAIVRLVASVPFAILAAWVGCGVGQVMGESLDGLER